MNRITAAFAVLLLAACARSEDAVLQPLDNNQAAAQVETVRPDRDDGEVALGAWRETLQDDQPVLEFGPTGAPALFSLRCDARRGVMLQRHGQTVTGDLPVMRITVGGTNRQLAVTATSDPNPMLRATLPAGDTLLPALSGASGPIAVRTGDAAPLNLPASPAIGAYFGRCANGGTPAAAAPADAEGNSAAPANQAAAKGD